MTWLYPVFILIGLVILVVGALALVWITAKIARGEKLEMKKRLPPAPIYDTPEQRNRIRAEARKANDIEFREVA